MMRALGPGSVSSVLKIVLDVFHFVLWVAVAGVGVAILGVLLLSFKPELLAGALLFDNPRLTGPWLGSPRPWLASRRWTSILLCCVATASRPWTASPTAL